MKKYFYSLCLCLILAACSETGPLHSPEPKGEKSTSADNLLDALREGNLQRVGTYLDQGGDPNRLWTEGIPGVQTGENTLLHEAVRQKLFAIAEMLLKRGANPNLLNSYGHPPLWGSEDLKLWELLMKHGANPHLQTPNRASPFSNAISGDNFQIIQFVLKQGFSPIPKEEKGGVLFTAQSPGLFKLLLKAGADFQGQDFEGKSLLHRWDNTDILTALLEKGLSPQVQDREGNTPLHSCVLPEKAELLLAFQADPWRTNKQGQSPLDLAIGSGNVELAQLLVKHMQKSKPQKSLADMLMQNSSHMRWPPILAAISSQNPKMLSWLLEMGVQPQSAQNGQTPLLEALGQANPLMLKTLMQTPVDVHLKDAMGVSPFLNAILKNAKPEILALLVEAGADPQQVHAKTGQNAIHFAIRANLSPESLFWLLQQGVDPELKDLEQKQPLEYITEYTSRTVIQGLLESGKLQNLLSQAEKARLQAQSQKNTAVSAYLQSLIESLQQGKTPLNSSGD